MFSTTFLIIVSFLIGHLVISAIHGICILYYRMEIQTTHSLHYDKFLTKDHYGKNLRVSEQAERASLEIFAFISTKTPISFNVLVGTYE